MRTQGGRDWPRGSRATLAAILAATAATTAHAADNCSRPPAELRAACADETLAGYVAALGVAYDVAMSSGGERTRARLARTRQGWLREMATCGDDARCISASITARQQEVNGARTQPRSPMVQTTATPRAARVPMEAVIPHAAAGDLRAGPAGAITHAPIINPEQSQGIPASTDWNPFMAPGAAPPDTDAMPAAAMPAAAMPAAAMPAAAIAPTAMADAASRPGPPGDTSARKAATTVIAMLAAGFGTAAMLLMTPRLRRTLLGEDRKVAGVTCPSCGGATEARVDEDGEDPWRAAQRGITDYHPPRAYHACPCGYRSDRAPDMVA